MSQVWPRIIVKKNLLASRNPRNYFPIQWDHSIRMPRGNAYHYHRKAIDLFDLQMNEISKLKITRHPSVLF